jgi:chromosome segregation ATPase
VEITDVRTLEAALAAHADMAKSMEARFAKLAKKAGKLGAEVERARISIRRAVAAAPEARIGHIQNAEQAKANITQLMPELSSDFKATIEEWTAHVNTLKSFQAPRR